MKHFYTEDHDIDLKGDKVKVEGFRACGWPEQFWEHFIEHRSETTLTHSPIWRQGEFFLASFDWEHGPDLSEFHDRRYHEPMVGEHDATTVLLDVPPSSCSEAQKCSPIRRTLFNFCCSVQ